ncbi:hypothetical protein G7046_g9193 [Stylonectria norvegica]|nr:hypothetical protein G7046_g9193 [Stylonectria norvegica]
MLSRLAQAPRLGLMAARFARPVTSPVLRARPASISFSPWARTYAKGRGRVDKTSSNTPKPPQPNASQTPSSKSDTDPSQEAAKPSSDANNEAIRTPEEEAAAAEAQRKEEQIAFDKLPDLTQGIPSTLEYEMENNANKSDSALQQVEQEVATGGRGRGRQDSSYVSTNDRNRRWWARFMLVSAAAGATVGILFMGRDWEDEIEASRHPDIPNGFGPGLWWRRAKSRLTESVTYYQEPSFEKLLPDPDPTFERPYTLCISLDDLLVHSEWSREYGWRVAKRPGVDYFIRYLSQYYELVLFTSVPFATGETLVRKLDPFRFIMWPLYREATKYEDGEIVKDLSYLNRDLSKVIIIDTNAKHVRNQPENAVILDPWKGDTTDKELVGLIPFLEYIHTMQYSDVRKVLKSFNGKHIPTEFARREAIARKEFEAQLQTEKSRHSRPSGVAALGSMLGLKPSNMSMTMSPDGEQNPSEAFAQGKMLQDIARERGQRNYEMLEKEIRENGEKWLKEEKDMMEKAQAEAMTSVMGSFSGIFGGKEGPTPAGGPEKKA